MAFGDGKKLNKNLTKKEKVKLLKKKHEPLFKKFGIVDPLFIPKVVFGSPKIVYLFPSELNPQKDIYTEKVSKQYESEDEDRILYKWPFNPAYKDTYRTKKIPSSSDSMYIVPFEEFEPIVIDEEAEEFDLPDPDSDAPISELTIRDLVAILHKKPVSQKSWLNKIIK